MDTLRTMTGKTAVMTITRFDMALRVENGDRSDRFLIMPSRLDGPDPRRD